LAPGLFSGGTVWVLYLALEPYVRRYWPQAHYLLDACAERALARSIGWPRRAVRRDAGRLFLRCLWRPIITWKAVLERAAGERVDMNYLVKRAHAPSAPGWRHIPGSITFHAASCSFYLFLFRVVAAEILGWPTAAFVLLFTALKSASSNYPALEWPFQAILYTGLAAGGIALRISRSRCRSFHSRHDSQYPGDAE
jgi:hypothetical protein